MPTAKPRVTVTLEPRAYEVFSRLSAAGGESMSSLIAQLVDAALPSMERVVVVLERAKTAPQEALAGLTTAIERAERHLMPAMLAAQGMGDLFLEDMAATVAPPLPAPAAQRLGGGRKASPAPKDPRLVTRGSGRGKRPGKGVKRG